MRVCPYARQECLLAAGCATVSFETFGMDKRDLELDAIDCRQAGRWLFSYELESGELSPKRSDHDRQVWKEARREILVCEIRRAGDEEPAVVRELGL